MKKLTKDQRRAINVKTLAICEEVRLERLRQDEKWGEQNRPSVPEFETNSTERVCEELEIVGEHRAKFLCDTAATRGECTFAHIAIEELSEAVCADDDKGRRVELVQLAAVIFGWISAIDRRAEKKDGRDE